MEIWVALAFGWMLVRWLDRGRGRHGGSRRERMEERRRRRLKRMGRRRERFEQRRERYRRRRAAWESRHRVDPVEKRLPEPSRQEPRRLGESERVARLQQEWVAGRLTDRQFEEKLDAVYAGRDA